MKIVCKTQKIIVNYDQTVWPCCWVCTNKHESSYVKSLPNNWNSLKHHTLDEILKHEAFKTHFNIDHWQDEDKVDEICKTECDHDR